MVCNYIAVLMTTQNSLLYSFVIHTFIYTYSVSIRTLQSHTAVRGNLGFSTLPKDTSARRIGETGIKTLTFWLEGPASPPVASIRKIIMRELLMSALNFVPIHPIDISAGQQVASQELLCNMWQKKLVFVMGLWIHVDLQLCFLSVSS